MTQQEIQERNMQIEERNKQIALMLGWTYNELMDRWNEDMLHDYAYVEDLKFHSNWNWLMEAVKFINNTHNQDNPYRDLTYTIKHLLNGGWWKLKSEEKLIPRRLLSDIEQLFLAVSDFAKLYNEEEL
jgi:hypothetical protein